MQHMCRNDPEENLAPVRGWVKRHARTVFLTVGTLMLISELWKQLCLTFLLNGGRYQWPFFPFQLCSVSMYACILLYFCWGTEFGNVLLTFVKDFVLLAGMLAFCDTSGFREYAYLPLVVHSYCWHILMILIAVFAGIAAWQEGSASLSLNRWLGAAGIYLVCCGIAEILNLSLYRFGTINMFYISPKYRMQQIVFRDLIPVLGNNGTILLYICMTMAGAALIHLIWRCIYGSKNMGNAIRVPGR